LERETNADIARAWPEDPNAQTVLREHWSAADAALWEGFLWDLALYPWLAPVLERFPEGTVRAAQGLVLRPEDLVKALGAAELCRIVKRQILEESWVRRCPIDPAGRDLRGYRGALRYINAGGQEHLAVHLLDATVLHEDVRWDVGLALFESAR